MPDNYRPISQLSSFSKILEKVSSQQLTEYLDMENIISDNQFGFRKGHSTLHPLIVTRNELELAKNRNEFSILITLDLKKAFDTVESDQILPEKLKHYGCDSNSKKWFSSFFKNRKQYVSWKNHEAEVIVGVQSRTECRPWNVQAQKRDPLPHTKQPPNHPPPPHWAKCNIIVRLRIPFHK
jgi:hypothetical protein